MGTTMSNIFLWSEVPKKICFAQRMTLIDNNSEAALKCAAFCCFALPLIFLTYSDRHIRLNHFHPIFMGLFLQGIYL